MKKVLSITAFGALLVLPLVGLALEESPSIAPTVAESGAGLIALITNIGNWIFALLLAVAAIFLIYSGFLWVTAGGNPENVTKAKTMLINAIIGVAIGLGARGIVAVIRGIIGTGV